MLVRNLRLALLLLPLGLVFLLPAGCGSGVPAVTAPSQNDPQVSEEAAPELEPDGKPKTFETVQPDGRVITLLCIGDEGYNLYEDEAGYTVVQQFGEFRYAVRGEDGRLAASAFVVGVDDPAAAGLQPGIRPSDEVLAAIGAELAAAPKKSDIDNLAAAAVPSDAEIIEGDIAVPAADKSEGDASARCYIKTNHWPGGVVPYEFDLNVDSTNQSRMIEAMIAWENVANVRFLARTNEASYVHIFSGGGNWSYVGQIGGQQDLCIYNWTYKYIMAHELGHALGLWHEQSRADRDTFVRINWGNIVSGMSYNFNKITAAAKTGAYDFDSVMHYSACSFSNGACSTKPTISVLPAYANWQAKIGQRTHLSVGDAAGMTEMYGAAVLPAAPSRVVATDANTPFSGTLTATDPDYLPLTYRIVKNGLYGTAVVTDSATGAFTYTPNLDSNGKTDSFAYRASNGRRESLPATVTVKIFTGAVLPAEGTALLDRTVAFYWKAVPDAVQYQVLAGSSAGASDYDSKSSGLNLTAAVGNLPTDGSAVYFTVRAQMPDESWQEASYLYLAPNVQPLLVTPTPTSTLTGRTVTFSWTRAYGATGYQLRVGTTATNGNILSRALGNALSCQVSGVPTNGKTVYVQLLTRNSATAPWTAWPVATYTAEYGNSQAAGGPVISPATGTVLTDATATLTWTAVPNATAYAVTVESAPATGDILNLKNVGTARTLTVTTFPTDGRTVFVSIWAKIGTGTTWAGGYNWRIAAYTCAVVESPP